MYQSNNLSHTDALKIVTAIQAELEKENKGAAVAVVDAHGELIAFLRTDGCRLPSITIAINKAFTAAREQKPSKELGEASRTEGFPMTNFGVLGYVSWGGGLPIQFVIQTTDPFERLHQVAGKFLQEAQTATNLMLKGRLPVLPPRIKRLENFKRMVRRIIPIGGS